MVTEKTLNAQAPEATKALYKKHHAFIEALEFEVQSYEYSSEYGGSSLIIYQKDQLVIMVTKSRDGISYDFGDINSMRINDWYSLDIIRHFISNLEKYQKLKQISPIKYIADNIGILVKSFSEEERNLTIAKLKQFEKMRAKKLFG